MNRISTDINQAVALLNNEDVVAIPTETVYGLAGNIYSEKAIRSIFETKQRPFFNPLIVHIHSVLQINDVVSEFPEKAQKLAAAFWPGSLTLVLKKQPRIPDLITAGKDTVAVRVPNHPVTLELLQRLPFPLAAPSANPFGSISPTQSSHVANYFGENLSMVLEGGACQRGIESTIVGFEQNQPIVYRLGSISVEDIEAVVGHVEIKNNKQTAPSAPGMLSRHYAPETKTYLVDDAARFVADFTDQRIAVVSFSNNHRGLRVEVIKVLSNQGDLNEAAAKLYSTLHELDQLNLDMIVAESFPDSGLGQSINDRLKRATKNK